MPDDNAFGILPSSPVETGHLQYVSDHRMDRIPVLDVKKIETLTERLRFVISLDSQALPRMHAPEPLVQFGFYVRKHLVTSLETFPSASDSG